MNVRWLYEHWVATALFMGILLLLLIPVVAQNWDLAMVLIFAQLPCYMLHQVEEHTGDRFRTWVNQQVFGGVEALNRESVLWINLPGVWGIDILSIYAATFAGIGWGLSAVYLPLVNSVPHIVSGVTTRSYNPGLWTSILLFIPVGAFALKTVSARPEVSAIHHAVGLAVPILVHIAIIVYAKTRVARLRG